MIILDPIARQQMIQDAIQTFPDECCGFFFGFEKGAERTVYRILPVNNSKPGDKRRRFEVSPQDYLKAEQYADQHNLQLLGVYHSHPNHPAIPSDQDRIAAQPFFSYIIISIKERKFNHMRSWLLNDAGSFEEESIRYQYSINQIN
jgi:proteasome lid subunit RPN8/RPN11